MLYIVLAHEKHILKSIAKKHLSILETGFFWIQKRIDKPQFATYAQHHLYRILTSGWTRHSYEMDERSASWFGLEQRHPLRDRRIIEFGLAIPEEQRWRREQTKFILRQTMRGLLPESVRMRLTKADFSHIFPTTLQFLGGERLFSSLSIASAGWIKEQITQKMYHQMMMLYIQRGNEYTENTWPLWNVWGIELWFKTIFATNTDFVLL